MDFFAVTGTHIDIANCDLLLEGSFLTTPTSATKTLTQTKSTATTKMSTATPSMVKKIEQREQQQRKLKHLHQQC